MNAKERKQLNVLVADDNQSDVFIVSRGLTEFQAECAVFDVQDGESLLAALGIDAQSGRPIAPKPCIPRPDLILIDLYMPKMYGLQALKIIKRDRRFLYTPCVVMSHNLSEYDRLQAEATGASGTLNKCRDLGEFRMAVRDMESLLFLDRDSALPPHDSSYRRR